jgi:hypothetical protein
LDFVQSKTASELDSSSCSGGPTELRPHGEGLADAGGTVGGAKAASALEEAENSAATGATGAGGGGGGFVELR